MSTTTAPKTFRARSLTDALAQVRDELGPDAVVIRRREGLEGGVAGFFQRAVVEIEAQPGGSALLTAGAPGTPLLDDDAPGTSLLHDDAAIVPEPMPAPTQMAPGLARGAAAAGFAAALATAERTTEPADADAAPAPRAPAMRPHTDAAVDAIPHPRDSAPEVVPVVNVQSTAPAFVPEPVGAPAPAVGMALAAPPDHAEADRVATTLLRAGLSEAFSAAVLDEAMVHGLPFTDDGHTALRPLVARALARRLTVAPVSGARAVAVVGAGGSGKTAVVARLALAYAAARRLPVAVIALRSKDSGAELARLLAPAGVPMWATDDVEGAAARIANLRRGALVLVDTPALPPQMRTDPFVADAFAADLRRLGLDEVHFALPATLAGEVAREMLVASRTVGADRIAVTHSDATARLGMPVELAVETGLPISYLADSVTVRPAAAEDLAFALLP
jgi:flagellar biosynthesis protein FlhF